MAFLTIIQVISFVLQMIIVPVDLKRAAEFYVGCCQSILDFVQGFRTYSESKWYGPAQLADRSLIIGAVRAREDLEMNIIRDPGILIFGSTGKVESVGNKETKDSEDGWPQLPKGVHHRCPPDVLSRRETRP